MADKKLLKALGQLSVERRRPVTRDRFFCRRNLACFEACSICEVFGCCDMCVSFGQPDRCQTCVRSVPGPESQIETTAEESAAHSGTAPPPAEP